MLRICQAVKPVNHNFKPMKRQKILIPILTFFKRIKLKAFTGWVKNNRYEIYDQDGKKLLLALEGIFYLIEMADRSRSGSRS